MQQPDPIPFLRSNKAAGAEESRTQRPADCLAFAAAGRSCEKQMFLHRKDSFFARCPDYTRLPCFCKGRASPGKPEKIVSGSFQKGKRLI